MSGNYMTPTPIAERLASKLVRQENGCLVWTGWCTKDGYGVISTGPREPGKPRSIFTHRAAWQVRYGPIPEGMKVCHTCDNPPCCDTDHLFLGTTGDNNRDAQRKGRARGNKKSH